mgnify:CR=1 FL=1
MKKKHLLSPEEAALFREAVPGIKRLKNDTITHRPPRKKVAELTPKKLIQEQGDASYYFSDEFQPMLQEEGPVRHIRPDVSPFELKKLRRVHYSPELFLDFHGFTQIDAKPRPGPMIAS